MPVSVLHVSRCLQRTEDIESLRSGVRGSYQPPCIYIGIKLRSFEEQRTLLTAVLVTQHPSTYHLRVLIFNIVIIV